MDAGHGVEAGVTVASRDTAPSRRAAVAEYFSTNAPKWRSRYDRARSFDAYNYQRRAAIALQWMREIRPASGGLLLDLGCGAGVQAAEAAGAGWRVIGADMSTGMLAEAAQAHDGPGWVAASVEALPFRPASFDCIAMLGVIGYVEDPSATLVSLRRFLRPGGHLIVSWATSPPLLLDRVSDAVSWLPSKAYRLVRRRRSAPRAATVNGSFFTTYNRFWREREFLRLLEGSGFRPERVRALNYGQLRLAGRALWPESVDIRLTRMIERATDIAPFRALREGARTHLALARIDDAVPTPF